MEGQISNFPFEAHEDVKDNRRGIYAIVNLANNRIYIGSAVRLLKRKSQHSSELNLGKHINKHLQSSFNKYGKDYFVFKVVEYSEKESLIKREQFWIDSFDFKEELYNLNPTAGSSLGCKYSEETRKRMSESKKNISDETRQKISEANGKSVNQIDKFTGEILATFNSVTEAARTFGGSTGHISEVCSGKRKSAFDYKWRYTE